LTLRSSLWTNPPSGEDKPWVVGNRCLHRMVELKNCQASFGNFQIPRCIVFDTERERGVNATKVVEKNISSVVGPPEPRLLKSFCRIRTKEAECFFDLVLYFERARLRLECLLSDIIRHNDDPHRLGALWPSL